MDVMIRPFRRLVQRSGSSEYVDLAGEVGASSYVLEVGSASFVIPAVRTGHDERGPFAVVPETDISVNGPTRLSVEVDPDFGGAILSLYTLAPGYWELEKDAAGIQGLAIPRVSSRIEACFHASGQLEDASA
jgi:hypothetical protein